jgi:hypothetical protein
MVFRYFARAQTVTLIFLLPTAAASRACILNRHKSAPLTHLALCPCIQILRRCSAPPHRRRIRSHSHVAFRHTALARLLNKRNTYHHRDITSLKICTTNGLKPHETVTSSLLRRRFSGSPFSSSPADQHPRDRVRAAVRLLYSHKFRFC